MTLNREETWNAAMRRPSVAAMRRIRALRREAREKNQVHYFTGLPCRRGHVANRYVNTGVCVECSRKRDNIDRSRPNHYQLYEKPKRHEGVMKNWTYLTEAQIALWYMAVDRIQRGTAKIYRHHPLKER